MTEENGTGGAPSKNASLGWVTLSYLVALAAAWATIEIAPGLVPLLEPWRDSPIKLAFAADVVATLVIFAFSMAFNNSSFYDAYWSVIPIAVFAYWTSVAAPDASSLRLAAIFTVVFIWGNRLTFNWARGWTGLNHEDWRYVNFRNQFPGTYWLVSLGGIHFFPTLIVFAGMLAAWSAYAPESRPWSWIDILGCVLGLTGILLEWLADRQLNTFMSGPKQPGQTLREGLWRYSRHPNYLGEMLIWWSFFCFGWAADPAWAKVAVTAPLAMTGMFLFVSIPLLEKRSLERRANYQQVIDETSMLIPLPPRSAS